MSETLHLQRRGGIWHYYRRTPPHLVPVIGRRFFKRSLKTSSLVEARKLRTVEDLKLDALFSAAAETKAASSKTSADYKTNVSLDTLIEYVRKHVREVDRQKAEAFVADPPADKTELYEMWVDADMERDTLSNPEDPNRDNWIDFTKRRVLTLAGATIHDPMIDAQFAEIVRRGLLEISRRRLDRYEDRHDRRYFDKLFDPDAKPSMSFRQLKDIYLAEKTQEFDANNVSNKRLDKITAIADCLCEIIGVSTPVEKIDDDHLQRARSLLAKCPTNRLKIYPKLSLEDAIMQAAKQAKPTLSPITQSVYLDVLRDILKVGVRKKLIGNNPAADLQPLKKDNVPADQKRFPWSDEQLKGFFEGKFYRSCAPGASKPYVKPDRAWRFWLPLIMLLTGARPNEIAQLHVTDIRKTSKGTWYLDCNESDDEGKSLKTQTSKRRVPLHPELIRIGFLSFVEKRQKSIEEKGPRLFHELKANEYGNFAWYAAKRLNEAFIPAEITLGERQSLYSLRHNVRDALRRAKAPDETLRAIAGWAPNGKAVSSDYGDPGNPDFHVEWVDKIAYPGLDLSFLYRTDGLGKEHMQDLQIGT